MQHRWIQQTANMQRFQSTVQRPIVTQKQKYDLHAAAM